MSKLVAGQSLAIRAPPAEQCRATSHSPQRAMFVSKFQTKSAVGETALFVCVCFESLYKFSANLV